MEFIMKYTDDVFKKAYLSQLGLIKEDVDDEVASVDTVSVDTEDKPKKQITFITTDDQLVNTLGNEFETITITTKNPETEETEDITFTKDSFGNLEITDVVETDPDEIEECGDVVEEDEEDVEVVEEDDEDVEVVEEDEEDVEVVEEDEDEDEDEDDKDTADDEKEDDEDDEDDKDVATECKSKHKINSPY
jgi:hypothetical protein